MDASFDDFVITLQFKKKFVALAGSGVAIALAYRYIKSDV